MYKRRILLLCIAHACLANNIQASISIDTRFGYANSRQSYVFDTQQTFTQFGQIIGDVELRGGLKATLDSEHCFLGMTPPIKGELQLVNGGASVFYHIVNDMTFGSVTFGGLSTNPVNNGIRTFDFIFTGSYSIRLQKDLFLSNLTSFLLESSKGGILDGEGNKLTIDDTNITTTFVPTLIRLNATGFPGALTLKNISIEGIASDGNLSSNFVLSGSTQDIFFENVTLATYRSQLGFIQVLNNTFRYFGPNNVIGFGGTLEISSTSLTPVTLFKIAKFGRVRVTPLTTLRLSSANASATVDFEDPTSELFLDNCTVDIGRYSNMSIKFLGGLVTIKGNVIFTNSSGPGSNNKLVLGDGVNPANNCNIQILPGSKLIIDDNLRVVNMNIS